MESPWLLVKMLHMPEYRDNPVHRGMLQTYITGALSYWGQYEGIIDTTNP